MCVTAAAIADGEKVIAPLRQIRKPTADRIGPQPYVKLQASSDETLSHGRRYYLKAGFVQKVTPAYVEAMIGVIADANLPLVQAVSMPHGGGAIKRIKPQATAFAQRAADTNAIPVHLLGRPGHEGAGGELDPRRLGEDRAAHPRLLRERIQRRR